MEKIIRAALAVKFAPTSVDALLKVVMGTPNAQIATEILLDVYQHPVVNTEPHEDYSPNEANKIFISYDMWTDKVHYSYNSRKSKYGWYLKTLADYERYAACLDAYELSKSEYASKLNITEEEFDKLYDKGHTYGPVDTSYTRTTYCDLNSWNNNAK